MYSICNSTHNDSIMISMPLLSLHNHHHYWNPCGCPRL